MIGSDHKPVGASPSTTEASGGRRASAPMPDPRSPLLKLSAVGRRMDSLRRFIHDAVDRRTAISSEQLQMVSSEIASAVQEVILNSAALLASAHPLPSTDAGAGGAAAIHPIAGDPAAPPPSETRSGERSTAPAGPLVLKNDLDPPVLDPAAESDDEDCDIMEIDAAELLAEHVHFCEICGKGFKRDANLRMHMRAHGNRFKTLEALSKPDQDASKLDLAAKEVTSGSGKRRVRFSCPFVGCNRNQAHKKFRALKSVVCVKNHFKRSHCPKMYICQRCNKKSFSVVSDLKSHLKHCGENRWRCSCGTSFSRKDKLFGHIALFDGHMPAIEVREQGEERKKGADLEGGEGSGVAEPDGDFDPEFLKVLMEDFNEIDRSNWMVQ